MVKGLCRVKFAAVNFTRVKFTKVDFRFHAIIFPGTLEGLSERFSLQELQEVRQDTFINTLRLQSLLVSSVI